jgi:PAS domain-containing protein
MRKPKNASDAAPGKGGSRSSSSSPLPNSPTPDGAAPPGPTRDGKGALHVREVDVRVLLHELRVHQFELEMQNDELRRARSETELALQRYIEIFDFSPIGYTTLKGDHVIADVNLAASQILRRPRAVLNGTPFVRLVAFPDRPALEALIASARSSGEKKTCDLHLLRDGGEVFPARLSTIPLVRSEPTLLIAFEEPGSQRVL